MVFKPGDLVKLKSGGPVMTVERSETHSRPFVMCTWLDEDEAKQLQGYAPEVLQLAPPENPLA